MMFSKLVGKHAARIRSYGEEKMHVLKFFDVRGYLIMAVMMGGGIALRSFHLVPGWFIAFFYTGLGIALALAGVGFLVHYFHRDGYITCPVTGKVREGYGLRSQGDSSRARFARRRLSVRLRSPFLKFAACRLNASPALCTVRMTLCACVRALSDRHSCIYLRPNTTCCSATGAQP